LVASGAHLASHRPAGLRRSLPGAQVERRVPPLRGAAARAALRQVSPVPGRELERRGGGKPPYARYAFLNPYNLSMLAGAAAVWAATGHWWWGMFAAAGEAL